MVRSSSEKAIHSRVTYIMTLLSLTLCPRCGHLTVVEVAVPGCWLEQLLRTNASQIAGAMWLHVSRQRYIA